MDHSTTEKTWPLYYTIIRSLSLKCNILFLQGVYKLQPSYRNLFFCYLMFEKVLLITKNKQAVTFLTCLQHLTVWCKLKVNVIIQHHWWWWWWNTHIVSVQNDKNTTILYFKINPLKIAIQTTKRPSLIQYWVLHNIWCNTRARVCIYIRTSRYHLKVNNAIKNIYF